MRTTTTKTIAGGLLLLLTSATVACSDDAAAASDSPYCKTARDFLVFQMAPTADEHPDDAVEFSEVYVRFVNTAVRQAPEELHDDWVAYHKAILAGDDVLAKYDYDETRFDAEATDAEKAVVNDPGPAIDAAYHHVLRYEALTCGTGSPDAADVSYDGEEPGAYCEVLAKENEEKEALGDFLGDPTLMREIFTDPAKQEAAAATDAAYIAGAPKVIEQDVKDLVDWWNTKQEPVQAKFDYDIRKLVLEGSAQDRADFTLTDPDIRDQYARVLAYEQQVCGA